MILNLTELRTEFENLKKIRVDIKQYFENLSDKIQLLTNIYGKYIKEQENTGNILFGLDALHFQTFLIHYEYDNMKKMYILIENKLYCEYYKLFKLIINYVRSNINEESILKICNNKSKYPIYKDLEQYKVYDFELINNIHDDILSLFELMSKFVIKKEKELEADETNTTNGLNLHIVVNTIDFNITLLKQNLKLYTNYLKIFHKYHITYLSRLNIKIGIMWGQVNKDIKIERSTSPITNIVSKNEERKSDRITRTPSLTNIEQEELLSFIHTNNVSTSVKDELNQIMIHISDESSNDNESTNTNIDDNDKIDTNNVICSNIIEDNKMIHNNDIGALNSNELKERWIMNVNQIQMNIEDMNILDNKSENDENEEDDIISIHNEKDELDKWLKIISNTELTQEEKSKEKARLKRIRYKKNKKSKNISIV